MLVRVATPEDAADIAGIYAPIVEDTSISFEMIAPSVDEMCARIETTLVTHPWLVIEQDARVVAYAYAGQHRTRAAYQWSCDVSVYVGAEARRTGAARTLYQHLFATLVRQGFVTAFAGITLPNEPSVRFHEHMGFRTIGIYPKVGFKQGAWRSVGWWSRSLRDVNTPEHAPLLFSEHSHLFQTL